MTHTQKILLSPSSERLPIRSIAQSRCAGCLRRAGARLSPSVTVDLVCLVGAGHPRCSRPARPRRTWLVPSLTAGGGELDPVARTGDQVVEVLRFMGGEDSPRRVLCPQRAHLLASTLPAVARATAACSVRCECMIGRGRGLLRGSSTTCTPQSW